MRHFWAYFHLYSAEWGGLHLNITSNNLCITWSQRHYTQIYTITSSWNRVAQIKLVSKCGENSIFHIWVMQNCSLVWHVVASGGGRKRHVRRFMWVYIHFCWCCLVFSPSLKWLGLHKQGLLHKMNWLFYLVALFPRFSCFTFDTFVTLETDIRHSIYFNMVVQR